MPRINADGRVVMGVGAGIVSVDGVQVASGGAAVWLDATRVIFSSPSFAGYVLRTVNTANGATAVVPDSSGANELEAGGGRYLAWQAGRGVYGAFMDPRGGLTLVSGDGRGTAADDGTLGFIADRSTGLGFQMHAPSGQVMKAPAATIARDAQILRFGEALWRNDVGELATFGLPQPRQIGFAYGPRWVEMPNASPWIVYWTPEGERLVAHPIDSTIGVVVHTGVNAFYHDARLVGGQLRVAWSTRQGELPDDLKMVWDAFALPRVDLSRPPDPNPPDPQPQPPTCTITSYPATVAKGAPALCAAEYGGGAATRALWKSRSLGETVWFTDTVQVPPQPSYSYVFPDAGTVDIALRVEGPGGSDQTTALRRITVTDSQQPPEPEPMPDRKQCCFGPNLGSLDLQQLFTESNLWQWSYDRISAFQLYQGHIGPIGVDLGERFCQPNTFEALVLSQCFKKLHEAGILLELQMTGGSGPDIVQELAGRIAVPPDHQDLGGHLGAVCYDHMFQEIDAPTFAGYVRELRAWQPDFIIGAYCAFPSASVSHILERVQVWDELGGRPDFLRMDIDPNQRDTYTAAVHAEIGKLCHQRGMTHQVVITARELASDAGYIADAKRWTDTCFGLGFDAYAVQSWAMVPGEEARQMPHNLDEGDGDAHATLVRYVLERLP